MSEVMQKKEFASTIDYELKRAERYRIFLSLVVFNIGPVVDLVTKDHLKKKNERQRLLNNLNRIIGSSSREIDHVSNGASVKIGILMPETSRQGAETAARRIYESIKKFCHDSYSGADDCYIPIEISSFPDASGARSISSYIEDFA
jgi:hypothetical protein